MMPHRAKVAIARPMAAALVSVLVLAGPAKAEPARSSEIGPRAQAKVEVRLSVRPVVRLASAPTSAARFAGTSPLCLWSNFGSAQYSLRGEFSDGRSADLTPASGNPAGSCGMAGMMVEPVDIAQAAPSGQGRLVMLVIEGR